MRIQAATFAIVLLATSAAAQVPIAELSHNYIDRLGWRLHTIGDRDGDGRPELAAAYPGRFDEEWASEVVVYSWPALSPRWMGELHVSIDRHSDMRWRADRCGEALVVLRDDGGEFEMAIGAPGSGRDGRSCGVVETFAGPKDGSPRLRWKGDESDDEFGAALARVPDADGDERDDLAI